ncbi:tol-pal system-associated acyl-CoA thioesterase [Edaphovirga cremea]|uniref:tol-pal system-associated acyl-CoA thioesterase n=1 Tax=Edaphovirga cremea TaxID=2267246 RepID=UPI003989C9C4
MKTARMNMIQETVGCGQRLQRGKTATWRTILASLLLVVGLGAGIIGNAVAAPASAVANANGSAAQSAPVAQNPGTAPITAEATAPTFSQPLSTSEQPVLPKDLSILGMYQNADIVVKTVMIGLMLASVVTWAILFAKSSELFVAKRRLRRELDALVPVTTLDEASNVAESFHESSISSLLLRDAQNELDLSSESMDNAGIKDRTGFRLERRVAAASRHMGRGNGYLATIGAISPFVGLFGTVWGIMNSFIGIAQTQTTNLAVVAPGIAEALLATAIGLVAAIPAVVIYNIFARLIATYRHQVGDVAAQILLLQGRDLDLAASADARRSQPNHQLRVG